MKTQGAWIQGYNGQAIADCESQVIVAHELTNQENDRLQLAPMLEACENQAGRKPTQLIADAGYLSEANLGLEDDKTELFIPFSKERKHRWRVNQGKSPRGRIPGNATLLQRMNRKLLTKRGRRIYNQRAPAIEGVFGQMWTRGLLRFRLRGLDKVAAEWTLWCLTHNVLKLFRQPSLPR